MTPSTTRPQQRTGLTLILLALAQLIISIDYNIVYVALPDIGRELGFSAQSLQWVVSAYAVGFGGFLLLGGRAVDRLGPRRMFVLALLIYAFASLVGGLVSDAGVLIVARVAQGMGGALLFPATLALLTTGFPEGAERNRAMALWGVAGSSGVVAGAVLGGVLTNYLGWAWVFFVNVPLGLGVALGGLQAITPDGPRNDRRGGFDLPGALIATTGSTSLVFGLVSGPEAGWWSPDGAGAIIAGLLLLAAFLLLEHRSHDPLVPLRLLGQRNLATAMAALFVFMGGVNTLHYLFFLHLQDVLGYDALRAGLAFLPTSVAAMLGSGRLLPVLLNRWSLRRALFGGMAGTGIGIGIFAAGLSADGAYWLLVPGVVIWGLFAGMTFPALFTAAAAGVSSDEQGMASALASTAQQLGGAVGLALLVAVANAGLDPQPSSTAVVAGLRMAGFAGAVLTIAGAFIVLAYRRSVSTVATRDVGGRPADGEIAA